MENFPTDLVTKITKTKVPTTGDTYAQCLLSIEQLEQLIACGAADPEGAQNYSPTTGELLEKVKSIYDRHDTMDTKLKVEFIAYIIYPPRSDARVSIEGFNVDNLTADECLDLFAYAKEAQELAYKQKDDGYYWITAWWD